jgi:hypothetical protein
MVLFMLVCGRGSLLLVNLFLPYHKILNERHTNTGHSTLMQNNNHNKA